MNKITKSISFGDQTLTLTTGHIARQADAAVVAQLGDTQVLVAVVASKTQDEGKDFFPLSVHYQEKAYAAGKVPGGYFKREGRPTEFETLTSRLIDRPIRPLFPKGFAHDVQVIATLISLDPEVSPDIPAIIGASAALALSGLPFQGPIGGARVGYKNGIYQLNPTKQSQTESELDLVVAGTKDAVLMVESSAKELSEQVMLGAVMYGHEMMQSVIGMIDELKQEVGKSPMNWQPREIEPSIQSSITEKYTAEITKAYAIADKIERVAALNGLKEELDASYPATEENALANFDARNIFSSIEKSIVRAQIIKDQIRIDGRTTKQVRPIHIETSVLPRAHGSALFTRGETQALVVATLGTERDAQTIDALAGEYKERFMLHYNFPAYSVGEIGGNMAPKRREIGHGKLAHRATSSMVPGEADFPYVIRVVSEITESNGSSSMATVCGASLAMMDAGVKIKAPVSGIAMGLIKEGDDFVVLTDILGDEDHLGDMDFKVAGSEEGVTALQMDIKIDGITQAIMEQALEQAKEARLHILGEMNQALATPREKMSEHAPRILSIKIPTDKIRDVIGKGGATIRGITEETGAVVDITDDGDVKIYSQDNESGQQALQRVKDLTADVEVGQIYEGKVVKIVDFGAFVAVLPGKEGLLHISQIANERVNKVTDVLTEGQMVMVKVLDIDKMGKMKLSSKVLLPKEESQANS